MNGIMPFLFAFSTGYMFFLYFSHPAKKKHVLPRIKFKNIELLPNIRIHYRNTTLHLHHWLLLGMVTITSLVIYEGLQQLVLVKGVAIGGMIQGLRYKDRFIFRHPRNKRNKYL